MTSKAGRRRLCELVLEAGRRRSRELSSAELQLSAVVVAPHPDDEVLACGGTILRKVQSGARIHLVFLTDGERSHEAHIRSDDLGRMRRAEALRAAAILGVDPTDVVFLGYEDSRLGEAIPDATARLRELLARLRPSQVFAPFPHDWHADHKAASRIVRHALAGLAQEPELYEYTVYLWATWPWSGKERKSQRPLDSAADVRIGAGGVARFLARFDRFVRIDAVLGGKRSALEAYASQTSAPAESDGWWTFDDWSEGEFLDWTFSGWEHFSRAWTFSRARARESTGSDR